MRVLSGAYVSMVLVVYVFFSVIVATKMPGLTYLVAMPMFLLLAAGFDWLF